jgi:HTH-type transcriptional regulator / antitoxin HigA
MNWKVLDTEDKYNEASLRLMEIFHAEPNTPEDDELGILLLLVKDYDDRHYPMPELDALEVIKIKMQEMGLKNKDLEPLIGTKGHVSLVMNGKRDITLKMAQRLKNHFNIPAGVFLHTSNNAVVNVNTEVAPIRVVNKLQKVRAVSKK